jgi:fructose-bisphosphate aldolase, class II
VSLATTGDLVASAASAGSAVLAFNVITIEHAEGVADGVERAGVAAVLQISENTVRFHGDRIAPLLTACAQIATHSSAPLAIHLDHLQDVTLLNEAIKTAADFGGTSIMVDAAHLPYRDNVEATRTFTKRAHAAGLWVEAELGEIGGKAGQMEDAHAPGARTDPDEAAAFAEETAVDGLAVAVGSSHAMTTRDARLDLELIDRLASSVRIPLVLHGSSGVPDDQLRQAVDAGIRKLNVGTALNIAYTGAIREALAANPSTADPRTHLSAGRKAIGDVVADLCRVVAVGEVGAR